MTTQRDLDALLTDYLADGMTVLPDRVADAVVGEAHGLGGGPWSGGGGPRPSCAPRSARRLSWSC